MTRREEIERYIGSNIDLYQPLVEDMIFLENQLIELRKYPFLRVNPKDPAMQKATPAAKQYKELLQQYLNAMRTLERISVGKVVEGDVSPFRKYLTMLGEADGND